MMPDNTGWREAQLAPILRVIRGKQGTDRLLVTLDGRCASGKTTLARALGAALSAPVLHTDDFVVPHAQKTETRLAIPGGNCDWERLEAEVFRPWKEGQPVSFRRYDFRQDCLLPAEELQPGSCLIVEGSYCSLPALRRYADVRLFLSLPEKLRLQRLAARETPESLQRFYDRWIPLEEAYFSAYALPDVGCVVVNGEVSCAAPECL